MRLMPRLEPRRVKSIEVLGADQQRSHFFPLKDVPQEDWAWVDRIIAEEQGLSVKILKLALLDPERKEKVQAIPGLEAKFETELRSDPNRVWELMVATEYFPHLLEVMRELLDGQWEIKFRSIKENLILFADQPFVIRELVRIWPEKREELLIWLEENGFQEKVLTYAQEMVDRREWIAALYVLEPLLFIYPEIQERMRSMVQPALDQIVDFFANDKLVDSDFAHSRYYELAMVMGTDEIGITSEGKLHYVFTQPPVARTKSLPERPQV